MKKNPFKRRKKDQKPKEEDKQLVSTEREAAATNESQGGQLQVQVPSQHFPPPQGHVIVNPGQGNGQNNMTIINRFYYKIYGFPERKESDKPAISCMIRSMWTLLLLLIIVVVSAVAMVIIAVAILIFTKDEPEQEKMNKWERLFQILGGGVGTVLETVWKRLFG